MKEQPGLSPDSSSDLNSWKCSKEGEASLIWWSDAAACLSACLPDGVSCWDSVWCAGVDEEQTPSSFINTSQLFGSEAVSWEGK